MTFVKPPKLKNFPKHQIFCRNHQRRADRSGDARENCLIVCPLPNSTTEQCEKYRHLKYVKTSFDKKISFKKLN